MADDITGTDEMRDNLLEIEEAEERALEFQSGMRGLASEINKEMQKRNDFIKTGIDLSIKGILLEQAKKATAQGISKEQQLQGKSARIIWDMQKRITDEVESGSIMLRTQNDLTKEYINEMGRSWATLNDEQKGLALQYTKVMAIATKQYSSMSETQLEMMNATNQQLDEMNGRWGEIKKQVLGVVDVAKGLWNNPVIAGGIFGFEVFKKLKKFFWILL